MKDLKNNWVFIKKFSKKKQWKIKIILKSYIKIKKIWMIFKDKKLMV